MLLAVLVDAETAVAKWHHE